MGTPLRVNLVARTTSLKSETVSGTLRCIKRSVKELKPKGRKTRRLVKSVSLHVEGTLLQGSGDEAAGIIF